MAILKDSLVDLNYYKGNIVIQCNYNGKVFRYNAFKIPEKYFDKRSKTLKPCDTLFDYQKETQRIIELFSQINRAIVEILPTLSKQESITKKT